MHRMLTVLIVAAALCYAWDADKYGDMSYPKEKPAVFFVAFGEAAFGLGLVAPVCLVYHAAKNGDWGARHTVGAVGAVVLMAGGTVSIRFGERPNRK